MIIKEITNQFHGILAAILECETSKISMKIYTSQNSIHFYGSDFLDPLLGGSHIKGKQGEFYVRNQGACLECQNFPNSINTPNFPSVILKQSELYSHSITHVFN